ncbi:hypothetical protein L596_004615 [Steinernema carpocapsae]|uniref:Uncharacterized protein n=1 Tax=Steinernema carpocapsae TaxID=34508 RepID=A0A4V6I875_STECR|nr:hypothetical protein L596_004615 [Steinernema carpocapsae]
MKKCRKDVVVLPSRALLRVSDGVTKRHQLGGVPLGLIKNRLLIYGIKTQAHRSTYKEYALTRAPKRRSTAFAL